MLTWTVLKRLLLILTQEKHLWPCQFHFLLFYAQVEVVLQSLLQRVHWSFLREGRIAIEQLARVVCLGEQGNFIDVARPSVILLTKLWDVRNVLSAGCNRRWRRRKGHFCENNIVLIEVLHLVQLITHFYAVIVLAKLPLRNHVELVLPVWVSI